MQTNATILHWKERSHRFAPHFHTEFYIGVIMRGCCEFEANGTRFRANAGDLVLINPFEVHTAGCDPEVEYCAVYVDELPVTDAAGGQSRFLSFTQTVVARSPLAARLADVLSSAGPGDEVVGVLGEIAGAHAAQKMPDLDLLEFQKKVMSLMDEAYDADLAAPIAQLAARLGMQPQHFSRAFHRAFGFPAVFFRNQLRMHRAEHQLRSGAKPAEVAVECGFSDQSHLIRELKKSRGITPKLYAAAYRQLRAED